MKILILVLSFNDNAIYSKFYKTQKETWDSEKIDGVETFYYFGNSNKNEIIGNDIFVDVNESIHNYGYKTINTFELINDLEFDYVFRTNSSSYVDKKMLLEYVETKPKENYYSGMIGNYDGINFASGSGYFISKDLIKLVLNQKDNWNHLLIDDVAIAKILFDNNINPYLNERFDVINEIEIPVNFFHYRLKNKNRDFDVETMYRIKKKKDEVYNR
jgi:hypothetical protein